MKEFFFFIRKQQGRDLPDDRHLQFLNSCELYIQHLQQQGKLLSAQPIERTGTILSKLENGFEESSFVRDKEFIGGYYHILAENMEEAISIAKQNPEFQFNPDTRIEVRPIKRKEKETGFVYPKHA